MDPRLLKVLISVFLVFMHCSSVGAALTKSLNFCILFILAVICKVFFISYMFLSYKITCFVKLVMYLACPATISSLAICGAAVAHFVGHRIKKNVVVVVVVVCC